MENRMKAEEQGKFMPKEYEERIFGAVNGLCALRTFFQALDTDTRIDVATSFGIEWMLSQVINELMATALNCENGRKV